MAIIANNIRISFSSKVTENQTFDLTALFLRSPLLSSDSFFRPDGDALNTDPFLLNLPSYENQTFSLIIEQDLADYGGNNFSINIFQLETQPGETSAIREFLTIEINVIDPSSDTLDSITVYENQFGQIFDPAEVDFGLANPVTTFIISAGQEYVAFNNQNKIVLNPLFDPDDNDITTFTFTITASDGIETGEHTVTVNIERIDDSAPELIINQIDVYSHHLTSDLIITEDMINFTDDNSDISTSEVRYYIEEDNQPSGARFFTYVSPFSKSKDYGSSFTHEQIIYGLVGIEFTDLNNIDGLSLIVSDGFNISKDPVSIDFRREAIFDQPDTNNTIDHSAETADFDVNAGDGHDIIKTGSGDDIIAGGLGDDQIDLSAGGDDTVIYQFGRDLDGNLYAKDAYERITDFDRGNDTLVLKPNFHDDNLRSFDDYIAFLDGDDGV